VDKVLFFLMGLLLVSSAWAKESPFMAKLDKAIAVNDMKEFEKLLPQLKNVDEPFNDIKETPLTLAAYNDRYKIVEILIAKGANVNHQTTNGYSALMFAAMGMNPTISDAIQTVHQLLNAGANKSLRNSNGKTAYDLAIEKKHPETAQLVK
jgi:ankyrin repeat protein